jgi:hypothetical protein
LTFFRLDFTWFSGLQLVADNIIQGWQLRLKTTPSNSDSEDLSGAGEDFADIEPSHVTNTGLQPTLESGHALENVQNSSVVLGDNPSASAVLDACKRISIKSKAALGSGENHPGSWKDYPYDSAKRDQLLRARNRQVLNNQSNRRGLAYIEARSRNHPIGSDWCGCRQHWR